MGLMRFRVWHKDDKVMLSNHLGFMITDTGQLLIESMLGDEETMEKVELDNYIVMQYTGLKDKNGVEIYEGDILKIQTSDFYSKKIIDKYVAQVCFSRGGFFVLTDGHHTDFSLWGKSTKTMEVIGNIYEN